MITSSYFLECHWLKNCPTFYYINLDRSHERRVRIECMFKNYDLKHKRVAAVDGNTIETPDPRLSKYEHATMLSHLKAIEQFYQSKQDRAIICEDDMSLEFIKHWTQPVTEVIDAAPNDWQILMLGFTINPKLYEPLCAKDYSLYVLDKHRGAFAYCISRLGAKKILDYHRWTDPKLDRYTRSLPVADNLLFTTAKTYVYRLSLFTYPTDNTSTIHTSHLGFHKKSKKNLEHRIKVAHEKYPRFDIASHVLLVNQLQ